MSQDSKEIKEIKEVAKSEDQELETENENINNININATNENNGEKQFVVFDIENGKVITIAESERINWFEDPDTFLKTQRENDQNIYYDEEKEKKMLTENYQYFEEKLKGSSTYITEYKLTTPFEVEKCEYSEIVQRKIGDCCLLSSICSLLNKNKLPHDIIQKVGDNLYQIKTYIDCLEQIVIVSGSILIGLQTNPSTNQKKSIIITSFSQQNSLAPLLEKGFALIYGNYLKLTGISFSQSLVGLTGYPCSMIYPAETECDKDDLFSVLCFNKKRAIIIGTTNQTGKEAKEEGLYFNHAYPLVKAFRSTERSIRKLRLYNLHHSTKENTPEISDPKIEIESKWFEVDYDKIFHLISSISFFPVLDIETCGKPISKSFISFQQFSNIIIRSEESFFVTFILKKFLISKELANTMLLKVCDIETKILIESIMNDILPTFTDARLLTMIVMLFQTAVKSSMKPKLEVVIQSPSEYSRMLSLISQLKSMINTSILDTISEIKQFIMAIIPLLNSENQEISEILSKNLVENLSTFKKFKNQSFEHFSPREPFSETSINVEHIDFEFIPVDVNDTEGTEIIFNKHFTTLIKDRIYNFCLTKNEVKLPKFV